VAPEVVERFPEGSAPELPPPWLAAARTAAIALPALEAVRAAPARALHDLRFPVDGEGVEHLTEVHELEILPGPERAQSHGQHLVGALLVVAEGLAVEGDGEDLVVAACGVEPRLEPTEELLGACQAIVEGETPRDGTVVEEDDDLAPLAQMDLVGAGRIEPGMGGVAPVAVRRAHAQRLIRREDGVPDACLGERAQGVHVHGRLRKPEAFGIAPEPVLEVGNAPADLGAQVARRAERKNGMAVGLGERVPVPPPLHAVRIGLEDPLVGFRPRLLQPREQGRSEVEGNVVVVVDDVRDAPGPVLDARCAVRRVALGGDALVPVVEGVRRVLNLDVLDPRVLARRLVEVAVQADEASGHRAFLSNVKVERAR